jgi:hypothetical protein
MSEPQENASKGAFTVGSLVVVPREVEPAYPLREDELQILCHGEVNEAKTDRDLYAGVCATALIGLIGLVASIDWHSVLYQGQWHQLFWIGVLILLVAGPGCGAVILHMRYARTRKDSPYSRVKNRISEHLKEARPQGEARGAP